ncbi:MAG: multicopper oxidase family protein [Actinomycetales bacterium]|nr:multicopper oxidase family protein [Actinomycetales bacterium]
MLGGLGLLGATVLSGCSTADDVRPGGGHGHDNGRSFGPPAGATPAPGQRVLERTLVARPATVDLGGPTVATWVYDDLLPGPLIRATAGDLLRVRVDNRLPAETTVHWHGIRLVNHADGVPGLTQAPIVQNASYTYEFTAPDPGTYFFHPHVGVQLDRGLYAALIIDDPREPGGFDTEWVIVLDDWLDGTGRTPEDALAELERGTGTAHDHGSMMGGSGSSSGSDTDTDMGMGMGPAPWGNAGDVTYPHFLVNGRVATAPEAFTARPGQRVRLRIINAASDTIFAVALAGHRLTVTHTDGYAVVPQEVPAIYLGMGERYDVVVTLGDGIFPLVAQPFGKQGVGRALVRTGAGTPPPVDLVPAELSGEVLIGSQLRPAESSRLPAREPEVLLPVVLEGQMQPYRWTINGAAYGANTPLRVQAGQRVRLRVSNHSMMTHPVHVHGHTFALGTSGLRKDTVLLRHMETRDLDFDADNTGSWMVHCHNAYHGEAGMMIELAYR